MIPLYCKHNSKGYCKELYHKNGNCKAFKVSATQPTTIKITTVKKWKVCLKKQWWRYKYFNISCWSSLKKFWSSCWSSLNDSDTSCWFKHCKNTMYIIRNIVIHKTTYFKKKWIIVLPELQKQNFIKCN